MNTQRTRRTAVSVTGQATDRRLTDRLAALNYRHLHYFWVVAREGSITAAAERLGLTVQTISAQLTQLEQTLGISLLALAGRRLLPTEAGKLALTYADSIFLLGEQMQNALRLHAESPVTRLRIGVSDATPKALVSRLLAVVFQPGPEVSGSAPAPCRLHCTEDEFDRLLTALALHRLDLVLTDRPLPAATDLRLQTHLLGQSAMGWYGTPALAGQYGGSTQSGGFPGMLHGAPVILPLPTNAVREQLDYWFERHQIRPRIVAECEDSALLTELGRTGTGFFPASAMSAVGQLQLIGLPEEVHERVYGLCHDASRRHPMAGLILDRADR